MKKIYCLCGAVLLLLSSCGYFEYDNYEAPNSGLEGEVLDAKTGAPILGEAANSYKVEYYELSWEEAGHANTQSQFFWGKADGSFMNTKIFAGKYRVTLKEGAFYAPEPEVVFLDEGKLTELSYSVVPYARVTLDEISLSGSSLSDLIIKYTVEDTETEIDTEGIDEDVYSLSEAQVFISSKSPNVGINNSETKYTLRAKKEFVRGDDYVPGEPFQVTERNVRKLAPGRYWVRIGVRTGNPQKRYNFSETKEIVVPEPDAEE